VTIAVPPTLPAAMTIGTTFSLWRLRKKGIFCISPPKVDVSGTINTMVLDKTGTLTEDGLQVLGFKSTIL
jgi:cation-transporting ATPase 13A3/4/5